VKTFMTSDKLASSLAIHHTKSKGDLGVAKAYCDLVEKGFIVLFPATEHAPFDLVSYDGNRFVRIQVKYRRAVRGSVHVPMKSWWADRNGSHGKQVDKSQVDVFCVYCPDTDKCYYFKPDNVKTCFSIRVAPSKNNQAKNINFADDYTWTP
jgi:PD-(D/E)XK endonuclease